VVVVSVVVVTLVKVVLSVAVVTDVSVTVVGGRDVGARVRVADTRTPATSIAAATYPRLLFPLPCNASHSTANDGALPLVNTFVQTAPMSGPSRRQRENPQSSQTNRAEECLRCCPVSGGFLRFSSCKVSVDRRLALRPQESRPMVMINGGRSFRMHVEAFATQSSESGHSHGCCCGSRFLLSGSGLHVYLYLLA
jgi:hypothetical protein